MGVIHLELTTVSLMIVICAIPTIGVVSIVGFVLWFLNKEELEETAKYEALLRVDNEPEEKQKSR